AGKISWETARAASRHQTTVRRASDWPIRTIVAADQSAFFFLQSAAEYPGRDLASAEWAALTASDTGSLDFFGSEGSSRGSSLGNFDLNQSAHSNSANSLVDLQNPFCTRTSHARLR